MTMMERLILLTGLQKFLFFSHARRFALPVLLGLLLVIPGINAQTNVAVSGNPVADIAADQPARVTASTTNEEFMPTPPMRITISGKITTPDGHPVEGATIRTEFFMTYDTQSVTVESGADGSYRINNAHGFNQTISVGKTGYNTITKEMNFRQNVNTVDFILEPATKPAPGFSGVLCLLVLSGSLLIIFSHRE